MNLQFHLLSRITVAALMCLFAIAAYVLYQYQSDRQARQATQVTAEALGKQLEIQLLGISAGFGQANRFPDFDLWKQTASAPGICVRFVSADSAVVRSLCNGAILSNLSGLDSFETFYHLFLNPGLEITRPISFNGRVYGSLTVTPNAGMEIAQAWENIRSLFGLSALTVLAVCLLVYLSISHQKQSAGSIAPCDLRGLFRPPHPECRHCPGARVRKARQ